MSFPPNNLTFPPYFHIWLWITCLFIKFELLGYNHVSSNWGNQGYIISHRVVVTVCDIVILMRSLWVLISKMVDCLDWLKSVKFGLVIFILILVFFFPDIKSGTRNIHIMCFCWHIIISLSQVQTFVKIDGIMMVEARIECIYRCWLNACGIHHSGGYKEFQIQKNWWK